jgi:hypothetical protein
MRTQTEVVNISGRAAAWLDPRVLRSPRASLGACSRMLGLSLVMMVHTRNATQAGICCMECQVMKMKLKT